MVHVVTWKVTESSGIFPSFSVAWKVLEINIGSGKSWKFDDVESWQVLEFDPFQS